MEVTENFPNKKVDSQNIAFVLDSAGAISVESSDKMTAMMSLVSVHCQLLTQHDSEAPQTSTSKKNTVKFELFSWRPAPNISVFWMWTWQSSLSLPLLFSEFYSVGSKFYDVTLHQWLQSVLSFTFSNLVEYENYNCYSWIKKNSMKCVRTILCIALTFSDLLDGTGNSSATTTIRQLYRELNYDNGLLSHGKSNCFCLHFPHWETQNASSLKIEQYL